MREGPSVCGLSAGVLDANRNLTTFPSSSVHSAAMTPGQRARVGLLSKLFGHLADFISSDRWARHAVHTMTFDYQWREAFPQYHRLFLCDIERNLAMETSKEERLRMCGRCKTQQEEARLIKVISEKPLKKGKCQVCGLVFPTRASTENRRAEAHSLVML